MQRKLYATLAILAVLVLAAPAHADMQLGMQDDPAMLEQPGPYLDRADYVGASWVRIMAMDNRWPIQAEQYVRAVSEAKARGKNVMVSLLAWWSQPTPGQWRSYVADVVGRMAPYVDAWSPMNEPNQAAMGPYTGTRCVQINEPLSVPTTMPNEGPKRRWKRVRPGRGKYLRHVKHSEGRRVVRYRKARTRWQRRHARWRRINRAPLRTVRVTSTTARKQCSAEAFGTAYGRVWDATAPVIRELDPDAQLIVGDLAPGSILEFMRAFYDSAGPVVRPDVLGAHYPDASTARWMVDYAARHDLKPWVTEWARSAWDLFHGGHSTPGDWVHALDALEDAGVPLTVIYDAQGPSWDTKMRDDDLEAVRSR